MRKKKIRVEEKNTALGCDKIDAHALTNHTQEQPLPQKKLGIDDDEILQEVIVRAAFGMPIEMQSKAVNIVGKSTMEMEPKDPLEAKLCAKEATLYSLAMTYLQRAESNRFADGFGEHMLFEADMNFALKLLKIHNETIETLSRYRRQGEQKVIVQHQYGVQVLDGGQAIVGGQLHLQGGGGGRKMQEEPHG